MMIPSEIRNLKPPTRDDAIAYLRRRRMMGSRIAERFEDSQRGQQCADGKYRQEKCEEYQRAFNEQREAAIADAMIGCQREYDEQLARRQRIEAHNREVLSQETATLRERYMRAPGATSEAFEKALPDLLEARRQREVLEPTTVERMAAQMRDRVRI